MREFQLQFKKIVFASCVLVLSACQTLTTRHEPNPTNVVNAHDQKGPHKPGDPTNVQQPPPVIVTQAPQPQLITGAPPPPVEIPVPKESPRVGIILGPGGMRTFAHIGVLKEFARARIPINYVVGLEWGAVMGGLYSMQGQVNELEFKAMRMRESDVPGKGFLGSRIKPEQVSIFGDFLGQVFGNNVFEKNKVDFACPTYNTSNDRLVFLGKGSLRDGLSKCLPYPPYFSENRSYVAAPFDVEEAANFLRARNINLVIFVNVMSGGEVFPKAIRGEYEVEQILMTQLQRELSRPKIAGVNQIIQVNTSNTSIIDFESRRNLIEQGSSSAKDTVNKLVNQYGF